ADVGPGLLEVGVLAGEAPLRPLPEDDPRLLCRERVELGARRTQIVFPRHIGSSFGLRRGRPSDGRAGGPDARIGGSHARIGGSDGRAGGGFGTSSDGEADQRRHPSALSYSGHGSLSWWANQTISSVLSGPPREREGRTGHTFNQGLPPGSRGGR